MARGHVFKKGIISAPLLGAVTTSTSLVSRRMVYEKRMKKNIRPSGSTFLSSFAGLRQGQRRLGAGGTQVNREDSSQRLNERGSAGSLRVAHGMFCFSLASGPAAADWSSGGTTASACMRANRAAGKLGRTFKDERALPPTKEPCATLASAQAATSRGRTEVIITWAAGRSRFQTSGAETLGRLGVFLPFSFKVLS